MTNKPIKILKTPQYKLNSLFRNYFDIQVWLFILKIVQFSLNNVPRYDMTLYDESEWDEE